MNTEIISNASSPPRPLPQRDTSAASTSHAAVPEKAPEVKKASQVTDAQNSRVPDKQEVKQAVEKISNFVSSRQSELSFSIDDVSGSQVVKIMDTQTKQVIRQFPSEEAVAIAHALDKLQGLLIKDKA